MDTAAGTKRAQDGGSALSRPRGGLGALPAAEWRRLHPDRRARPHARTVTVAVCEEHEILRAGLLALLAREPALAVAAMAPDQVNGRGVELAIVSSRGAGRIRFECPIVIVSEQPLRYVSEMLHNDVLAVLHRGSLTASQLLGTVRTAAERLQPQARRAAAPSTLLGSGERAGSRGPAAVPA